MDYRNADGSLAEMCGNGARVFARYLVAAGLVAPGRHGVATRGGVRQVDVPAAGDVSVGMGPVTVGGPGTAELGGRRFTGTTVSVGNPHLVCVTTIPVAGLDVAAPPVLAPAAFPAGVNVEVVNVLPAAPDGFDLHVRMRVHERGSGETRSCGTGAVAVAAVALRSVGRAAGRVVVDVPGGRLAVTVGDDAVLSGPAVLVAAGELDPGWLTAVRAGEPVLAGAGRETP
jgi:diaminopimelate epimerase